MLVEGKTSLVGSAQTPFNLKKKPHPYDTDHNQNNSDDSQHGYSTQNLMGHGGLDSGIACMTGKNL
jgi:hypothetical protein